MRSAILAASVAAIALCATAQAQNSLVASNPLTQWGRGPAAGGPEVVAYMYDDGSSENAIGITCGGAVCNPPRSTMVWTHYWDTNDPIFAGSSSDTITRIDVAIGNPPGPTGPPQGTTFDLYIFNDPNDDGNPSDLAGSDLVMQMTGNVNNMPDTDSFEMISIPPTVVTGGFFVLATMDHELSTSPGTPGVGEFPGPLDQTLPNPPPPPRVWANCFNGVWVPSNPQATNCGGWIDLQNVGFQGVWLLRAEGSGSGPSNFCTAKAGLVCGTPAISAAGAPSATATSGFTISAAPARSCKSGILVYNTAQLASGVPFQGGTLCVETMGLRRAGSTNSGGTPGNFCNGVFAIDMNAFAQSVWVVPNCDGTPSATPPNNSAGFLTVAGTTVFVQYWGRDSVASGSYVSDGVNYVVGP